MASVWLDFDKDGDLDVFLVNQRGDRGGFYKNNNVIFTDIAIQLNMDISRRSLKEGSVGVSVGDYNNDGGLDTVIANSNRGQHQLF